MVGKESLPRNVLTFNTFLKLFFIKHRRLSLRNGEVLTSKLFKYFQILFNLKILHLCIRKDGYSIESDSYSVRYNNTNIPYSYVRVPMKKSGYSL